jgi:GT2 family glycosyltransferase
VTVPDVSVIVLGWNGRQYVDGCLNSLLDQDFERPYEVLFVDNGSTDGTADAASQYEGVRVHRLDRNYGFCGGNNKGFLLAHGELVVFLNQDVIVHRAWLRELVNAVESDANIKAAHANIVHPWNPEFGAKERDAPLRNAYVPDLSRFGFIEYRRVSSELPVIDTLFLSGASTILRRDVYDEIGAYVFDPDMFAYGEDMDLGLRLHGLGYRTVVATRATVYHFHTLKDRLSLASALRVVRIIRNRLLALWKNSTWPEFAVLGSVTVAGAPLNAGQFGLPGAKRFAYLLLLIPAALVAMVASFAAMPRYAGRRRAILEQRRRRPWWLVRELLFDRKHVAGEPLLVTEAGIDA